jgi:hypothetical protein
METLSREGQVSWPAFKRSDRRGVKNHGRLVAWALLALTTSTALAPEHTPSRRSPARRKRVCQSHSVEVPRKLLDPTKYSSYWKLLRVTAWILRFRRIAVRRDGHSGNLTASDMESARSYWIQAVQGESFAAEFKALRANMPLPDGSKIARFNPFLDEGFFRLGGWLQFAKVSREQHRPLLFDGQHRFTKLLILETHIRFHHLGLRTILSGLREEFWILRARQTIKQVLNSCLPCQIARGLPGGEI